MADSRDQPEFESLGYEPKNALEGIPLRVYPIRNNQPDWKEQVRGPAKAMINGLNTPVIKPETRINKTKVADQHLDEYTPPKCALIDENGGVLANPEQPDQNLMIFEQVEGSIDIALKLLKELEVSNTMQETDKQGCIWTLDGWKKHNLKHLRKAFE